MMESATTRTDTLRMIFRYMRGYKTGWVLSLLLCMLSVGGTLFIPVLTGQAIDSIVAIGGIDWERLLQILIKIGITAGLSSMAQWFMEIWKNRMTYGVVRDIRSAAFGRIQKLPLSILDQRPTGDLVSRVIADVDQFADGLLAGFNQLFSSVLTILGTLFFMYSINAIIATAVVLITPLSLGLAAIIGKRSYALFLEQGKARGEQTALIDEFVSGQRVVKAFSQEERVQERFDEVNQKLQKFSLKAIFCSSIIQPGTRFVNALVYTCVGVAGAIVAIGTGGISIGQLSSFLSYANQYTKPFNEISGVVTELQNALACARRVFELIHAPVEPPDAETAKTLTQVDGRVALQNVDFSYDKKCKLIENLNLEAQMGQRIAIVGPTGCGKTTLINLLMRFYDVDGGAVCVSGVDVRELTRASLRGAYGMVLQETWLKTGTVRENICMGREDASEAKIIAAAKATHAHSFIKRLPKGYDTMIAEDGGNLSQGEKQLLCITRVMLRLPPMLILDEATSSIDTRTEGYVQVAFERMMEGRTSFVVAHRLSTIQTADVILVMNQGRIVEQGTHEELIQKQGFYATLYQSQFAV